MLAETIPATAAAPTFLDLAARFPRGPIADERSYRAALAILDRLFALPPARSRAERVTFRALARRARRYEDATSGATRPAGSPG